MKRRPPSHRSRSLSMQPAARALPQTPAVKPAFALALGVLMALGGAPRAHAQGLTATSTFLTFGKDGYLRPAGIGVPPFPAGTATVSAPVPVAWELPGGSSTIYAAVPFPGGAPGTTLTGDNIDVYNSIFPLSVIYEAPNHPYVILTISQGGVTALSARVIGAGGRPTNQRLSARFTYGRPRIAIDVPTALGAQERIQLGVPTPITFAVPGMLGAGPVRIDFNETVQVGGASLRILDLPAPPAAPVTVTFDPHRATGFIRIDVVATAGAFLDASPPSAQLGGLRANGPTLSGARLYSAVPPPAAALAVTKTVDDDLIRAGGGVTYTYTATNGGPAPPALSNVVIWDNQLGNVSTGGALAPGGAITVTASKTDMHIDVTNYAMVTATDAFGNPLKAESGRVKVRVIDPALGINLWQDGPAKVGKDVDLKYEVRNDGDVTIAGVTINDGGWVRVIPKLEPGEETTITRKYRVPRANDPHAVRGTAGVPDDPGGGPVTAQDAMTLTTYTPSIAVTIVPDHAIVNLGDHVIYTVTVTNTGDIDLGGVTADDDKAGHLGTIPTLRPGESQTYTFEEDVNATTSHTVTASGTDYWSDVLTDQASVTVEVILPGLAVTVIGSFGGTQSSTVLEVDADQPVSFSFTVQNIGNCELTGVKLRAGGQVIAGVGGNLAAGASFTATASRSFKKDSRYRARVTARDPLGDLVSGDAEMTIHVKSLIDDMRRQLVTDGRRLADDIERLQTQFDALVKQFYTILAVHHNRGSDPCADARPPSIIVQCNTINQQIKARVKELQTLVDSILQMAARQAAGEDPVQDLLQFLASAGRSSGNDREIADMREIWRTMGCGEAGNARDHLITVAGKVLNRDGNPVAGAVVACDGFQAATGAGGEFSGTVAVDDNETVTATATATIPPGFQVQGSSAATYAGQDPLRILITLDTSPNRPVTVKGLVQDRRGQALDGVAVKATSPAGGGSGSTGSDGSYSIGLTAELGKPITVTATVSFPNAPSATGSASVEFAGESEITVPAIRIEGAELPQIFTIHGVAIDSQRRGLAGARVETGGFSAVTDAAGAYKLGPLQGVADQEFPISATINDGAGNPHSTATTLTYAGGDPAVAPDLVFGDLVQEMDFTITGWVVDGNGKPIDAAAVTAGSWSGSTSPGGTFASSIFSDPVGTAYTVSASVSATDGQPYSASKSVTYQGGETLDAGTLTIAGVEVVEPPQLPAKALSASPARKKAPLGEAVAFTATAILEDDTTADVTAFATWSQGSNQATSDVPATIENTASYEGFSASASVVFECPQGTTWDTEKKKCAGDIDEAINQTGEGEEDLCDPEAHLARSQRVDQLVAETRQLPERLEAAASTFFKGVNDQLSDPCANASLARLLSDARSYLSQYERNVDQIQELATGLIMAAGICPELGIDTGELLGSIAGVGGQAASMQSTISGMRAELGRHGCDEEEVEETGETTAEGGAHPETPQVGGGGGVEICGDGIDNNGNGLQDEGCDQQTNANVTIFVYDSGPAKDDIFQVEVAGQRLGTTPVGGARTFSLALAPGDYVCVLTVIEDGGNVGTYTISILQGDRVLASQSGSPVAGVAVSIPFTVGQVDAAGAAAGAAAAGAIYMDPSRVMFPGDAERTDR